MKTVFLDRDGVINKNLDNDYVKRWDEFEFLPKSREAIKALTDAGWDIVVISNQAGVGKGLMTSRDVREINANMIAEIERCGGKIKAVYFCPHKPDDGCDCRKPKPGMLLRAAREYGIELTKSYLIGDKITDIQTGAQVGCTTILVRTGKGEEDLQSRDQWPVSPDYIAADLFEAVQFLLNMNEGEQ